MDKEKKTMLADFASRALQRLHDKKVPKKQRLYVPSMDQEITIRNLSWSEVVECQGIDEPAGSNRADRYCIYLAVVDPDLKSAAKEIMDQEKELPTAERELKEALDIVNIFEPHEITELAMAIMKLSGVIGTKSVTVVNELKN